MKTQLWTKDDTKGYIYPSSLTFETLDHGFYYVRNLPNYGLVLIKKEVETNKLIDLPNKAGDTILNDVKKFWTLEDTYRKYGRVFRRNYLLYSAPGTGKTCLIYQICRELIEKYNGIVIILDDNNSIYNYCDMLSKVREIEPERRIVTVIEDVDNYISYDMNGSDINSILLNVLDGNSCASNVVTIATTNFIDRIENRFKNRPSRFDLVVEYPLPDAMCRKMFIENSILPDDLSKIDIDKWVSRTEGYTIDHLNELILLFFVFQHGEDESFDRVNEMLKRNNTLHNTESVYGNKKIGFDDMKPIVHDKCECSDIPCKSSNY